MMRPSRSVMLAFLLSCVGVGLLALVFAQAETTDPTPLPPPFVSTQLPPGAFVIGPRLTPLADFPTITIASDPYRHPSGAFNVRYPDGWQLDEAEDSVQFTAPDDAGQYSVTFVIGAAAPNGDYAGDLRQTWSDLPAFSLDAADDSESPDRWRATFSFDQMLLPDHTSTRMIGFAVYSPRQNVLYIFTALAQSTFQDRLWPLFQSLADSLQTDPGAAIANSE